MEKIFCEICGMELNNKYFEINNSGLLKKNSYEELSTCPFCGANIQHFKVNELKCENYELDEKSIMIIDHAMKLEVFNSDFYSKASVIAKDKKIKDMFKALSSIEKTHAHIHRKLAGISELPKLKDMDYTKYTTDKELLRIAHLREEHAINYYNKYINQISDDKIKKIFEVLKVVEKEHTILIAG